MKRIFTLLMMLSVSGFSPAAEEQKKLTPEQIQAMEQRVTDITDPAARLFFEANIHRAKGEYEEALQTLTKLIVLYPQEKRWITRSELLCAKLYLDLDMLEAADVTARQVEFLNQGTEAAETARLLRDKIKQAKEPPEESEQVE